MPQLYDSGDQQDARNASWMPPLGVFPEDFAEAIRQYCDRPENEGLAIGADQAEVVNGKRVPLGELVRALRYEKFPSSLLSTTVRDAFDYHGMALRDVPHLADLADLEPGEVRTVHFPADPLYFGDSAAPSAQIPRPSGWEHGFITSLDEEFARSPGWWPQRLHTYSFRRDGRENNSVAACRLEHLSVYGLTDANWQRLPELAEAFRRHAIPLSRNSAGRLRPDRVAYSDGQTRRAGDSLQAAAASRSTRLGSPSADERTRSGHSSLSPYRSTRAESPSRARR